MLNQNRLNAVLARQKKGLVIDALVIAALVVAVGLAAVGLGLRLPSLAPAYGAEPATGSATPAAATATMIEETDGVCGDVTPSC